MKYLIIAMLALFTSSVSAAVIVAKTETHQLAVRPVVQFKSGTCQITGAVIVNGDLVSSADIGLRTQANPELIARTKTNEKGVYTLSVKVASGTLLQEIVISNPTRDEKLAVFPGQVIACK